MVVFWVILSVMLFAAKTAGQKAVVGLPIAQAAYFIFI